MYNNTHSMKARSNIELKTAVDAVADQSEIFKKMRGDSEKTPDATIMVPVNAQGDLRKVNKLLTDLSQYSGRHSVEIVLVLNNYEPDQPPIAAEEYRAMGIQVICIPNVRQPGIAVPLAARMPGIRAASSSLVILFDADCRVPNITAVTDWYIKQFAQGAKLAYTRVDYYELGDHWSISFRIHVHHLMRWIKRVPLRIPATRGSNYAVDQSTMVQQFDAGYLADDLNIGPAFKAVGVKIVYSSAKELRVLTSGRMFNPRSPYRIYRYFRYRFLYNLRMLPVRNNAHMYTKREKDPVRRYKNNKQVK